MKKIFSHKLYKRYADRYEVSVDGTVFNTRTGKYLKLHTNSGSGQRFVRLSAGKGISISIGLAKIMLLTFKGAKYKNGMIAISLDGNNTNIQLSNLAWGSRKKQSKIAMKNPINLTRVRGMGEKFGMLNWKRNLITDGKALMEWKKMQGVNALFSSDLQKQIKEMLANNVSPTIIARTLNIGRSSIYRYK